MTRTSSLVTAVVWAAVVIASAPAAANAQGAVRSVPVSFAVDNVNRSALPCTSDGARVTLRGRMIGTDAALRSARTVTLYLHEFSFGQFFWSFGAVPGYDHAGALAAAGHVAVVVDRLGYDESDRPFGLDTCLGAHADMAAQMVRALRDASYTTAGPSTRFANVVLAGHSVGAATAELALHSFPDLNAAGLMIYAWADSGFSQRTIVQSFDQGARCTAGGEPSEPGGPGAYAYAGQTEEEFIGNVFAGDADPRVVSEATRLRNRDPCGDVASLAPAGRVNASRLSQIDEPVLVLFGDRDTIFEPGTGRKHADAFTGSDDVTLRTYPRSGHALTLDADAAAVRRDTAEWLAARWPVGGRDATSPRPVDPGSDACRSRRTVRVRLPRRGRPIRATVTVAGRVVRRVRAPRRTVLVDLRGRPRGTVRIRIRVDFANGRAWRTTRHYRTCARAG